MPRRAQGAQEPGSNEQICAFAEGKGAKCAAAAPSGRHPHPPLPRPTTTRASPHVPGVSARFRIMDKVDVNGPKTAPVWKFLKEVRGLGGLPRKCR